MKMSTKKIHTTFATLAIVAVIFCLIWNWTRLSYQHTIDFAVQHQSLLEEYVALARSHSPEAENIWQQIKRYGYFTSVDCFYDRNGAIKVHFSVPYGGRSHVGEDYYQSHYCLLWQDSDYYPASSRTNIEWSLLGERDGITTTPDGDWYCSDHKHFDDGFFLEKKFSHYTKE